MQRDELKLKKSARLTLAVCAAMIAVASFAAEPQQPARHVDREQLEKQLQVAQRRLDEAAREVAQLSMSLSQDTLPQVLAVHTRMPQRAMLGITIAPSSDDRDEGVEIATVSPGGAAADAGLKAGDVLLAIDGKPLKREGDMSASEKLLQLMHEVEPEQKLDVSYRRDGKIAKATVTARPFDRLFTFGIPAHPGAPAPLPPLAFLRAQGVFGSAELVSLTPKLGAYFGTEKGLLVVRAPSDSRLKLEDGDVILDIDGRVPSSPSHALRILGSYQGGEKLQLTLLRAKKRMTLDITVPEDAWHGRIKQRFTPGVPGIRVPGPDVTIRKFKVPAPAEAPNVVIKAEGETDAV